MARRGLTRAQIRAGFGGKAAQRAARRGGKRRRRGSTKKGRTMARFSRARSYGKGLLGKVTSKKTLTVAALGAASNFVPPPLQAPAMLAGGAFSGSEALVDLGAYATGRQLGAMLTGVVGIEGGGSGGIDI